MVLHPRGHHMALRFVAVDVCRGGQVHCGAGITVSQLLGVAEVVGRLLALVARGRC